MTLVASPLDLALLTDKSTRSEEADNGVDVLEDFYDDEDWLFVADQWVPVVKLRRLVTYYNLQYVSIDPIKFSIGELFEQMISFT